MAATFIVIPPHARLCADGTHLLWDQNPVDLLQLDGKETIEAMLELDAAIMAAPFNHGRQLRRGTPATPG
jgi:hypothetical protein